jgi:hypothetical protein
MYPQYNNSKNKIFKKLCSFNWHLLIPKVINYLILDNFTEFVAVKLISVEFKIRKTGPTVKSFRFQLANHSPSTNHSYLPRLPMVVIVEFHPNMSCFTPKAHCITTHCDSLVE